jgi:TPR repeat protein
MLGKQYAHEGNYTKAFTWLHKTANNGDPDAQYLVGAMYFLGKGTEKVKLKRWPR